MITRLEIINNMLAVNGESPVTDPDSTNPAAIQANNVLTKVNRKIQDRGWWFNTEIMTLMYANSTGHVILPANTLAVEPVKVSSPYVQRGLKLYDTKNNTFVINSDVKVVIRSLLDIAEVPHSVAEYIDAESVYIHYVNDDGDTAKTNELRNIRDMALAYANRENLSRMNVNIRNSDMGRRLTSATDTGALHGGLKFDTGDYNG